VGREGGGGGEEEEEEAEEEEAAAAGNTLATSATEIPPRDFTIRRSLRNAFYRAEGVSRGNPVSIAIETWRHSFVSPAPLTFSLLVLLHGPGLAGSDPR
jgi:hypothetical protein